MTKNTETGVVRQPLVLLLGGVLTAGISVQVAAFAIAPSSAITAKVPADPANTAGNASQATEISSDALQDARLIEATVQSFDLDAILQGEGIRLRLDDVDYTLDLQPFSLRSPRFVLLVQDETGELFEEVPPPPATYRGRLRDDPDSSVSASIVAGQVRATIKTSAGEVWVVEGARRIDPNAAEGDHLVYRETDVLPGDGVCGVDDSFLVQHAVDTPGGGPGIPEGSGELTEIAFDTDVQFWQQNNSSVSDTVCDIESIMNDVGRIYQNQQGICYVISGIIVRTGPTGSDPYSSSNPNTLLCQFRTFWNSSVTINRNVAHLMVGRNMTGFIGLAWVGVICNRTGTACGGVTDNLGYGFSESMWQGNNTPWINRVELTAHELGHNWGACHCNNGNANPPGCTNGTPDTDCGIMWSVNGGGVSSSTFGTRSTNAIQAHLSTRTCLNACINPCYVDYRNTTGPWTGSSGRPFRTVEEGVQWVMVDGDVIIADGEYDEQLRICKAATLRLNEVTPGGTVVIGR